MINCIQVIAQQQALLANGGRPGGQQQPVQPTNSAAQQQQVMGLTQQQQGLGTAPGGPTVAQPGLGAGQQPRQPGGQNGLGGPYASHMQVCPT